MKVLGMKLLGMKVLGMKLINIKLFSNTRQNKQTLLESSRVN